MLDLHGNILCSECRSCSVRWVEYSPFALWDQIIEFEPFLNIEIEEIIPTLDMISLKSISLYLIGPSHRPEYLNEKLFVYIDKETLKLVHVDTSREDMNTSHVVPQTSQWVWLFPENRESQKDVGDTRVLWYPIEFVSLHDKRNFSNMRTSSNRNIFRVTGPLCEEFTGHRWIPLTKASHAELWCFFILRMNKWLSKQSWDWWFETLLRPLWRHNNEKFTFSTAQNIVNNPEFITRTMMPLDHRLLIPCPFGRWAACRTECTSH